jgi:hypothetical protein
MAERGVLIAMRRWGKLNERQLSVLQRISGAGEPVTAASPELATTVYALRDRGLVTTPRKDSAWRAEITDAGKFYLENGRHPDEPGLPGTRVPAQPVPGSRGKPAATAGGRARPPSSHAAVLIEQVRAEGGTLHIPDPDPVTRARYRSALDAAKRSGIVPAGYHLLHTGRDKGDLIIRLESDDHRDETDWNRIRLSARDLISVPEELAARLRDDRASLDVSEAVLPRALEVVQELAEEAGRHGYRLAVSRRGKPRGLHVHGKGQQFPVVITEECDEAPHRYTEEELKRERRYTWQRVKPKTDSVPSGRLRVEVRGARGETRARADDKRGLVETKIKTLVRDIGDLADAAEQARLEQQRAHQAWLADMRRAEDERKREEAARRARQEAAAASARGKALEDHRRDVIARALGAWDCARAIREFCAAMETAIQQADPERRPALRTWVGYAGSLADSVDPVRSPGVLADAAFDIDLSPADLEPYLQRDPDDRRREPAPRRQVTYDDLHPSGWRWGRPGRAQWWQR